MDPNPIKDIGSAFKRIRSTIEPLLAARGFALQPANFGSQHPWGYFCEYRQGDAIFSISFSKRDGQLTAEMLREDGCCEVAVAVPMNRPRTTSQILERCDRFAAEVVSYLERGSPAGASPSEP